MSERILIPTHKLFKDLTGQKFGRLAVVGFAGRGKRGHDWDCLCDCGTVKRISGIRLRSGRTNSCGCLMIEVNSTHGRSSTPEYKCWEKMISRCTNANDKKYKSYGGRGIAVCDRWQDSFADFYADMGPRPSKNHSIDRIDNNGNYEPGNCRWATRKQQQRNMRSNRIITCDGLSLCVIEWAEKLGIKEGTLRWRIRRGWSDSEIIKGR